MPDNPSSTIAPEAKVDVSALLGALFDGKTLSRAEAHEVMGSLMDGRLSQMQAAALLAAVRTRGETVEEIVGFAEAMRERVVRVPVQARGPLLDTCGTGGTGIDTFNISTAATFVLAAAGVRVAKHGNRAWTRRSGAADVLEALGANLDQPPERLARSIEEVGLAFLFARNHHPAMKFVSPVRADLKARTIFNSLGPLTNPAGANRQLMGVYAPALTEPLARVLAGLGLERAMVVHGGGLDELSVSGENRVSELRDGAVTTYALHPDEVGLAVSPLEEVSGGSPEENAATIRAVLAGEGGARRDIVALNAGAGLYLAERAGSIAEGVAQAGEILASGRALATLEAFVAFSQG